MRKIYLLLIIPVFSLISFNRHDGHVASKVSDTGYLNGDVYLYKKINLYRKSNSTCFRSFRPSFIKTADSAMTIASAVLNSQEFRDSLTKYKYPCRNYLDYCTIKCTDCEHGIIPSKVILDSLYRLKRDSIRLVLENNGSCEGGVFGESTENVFKITSHYITIKCDDTLSFAYKYAYHICHEYMHIVGFYHYLEPNERIRNEDIAEKTGWIAYDILTRWKKEHVRIPGIN